MSKYIFAEIAFWIILFLLTVLQQKVIKNKIIETVIGILVAIVLLIMYFTLGYLAGENNISQKVIKISSLIGVILYVALLFLCNRYIHL